MRCFYNVKRAFVWAFGSALYFATWMLRKTIDSAFDSSLMNSFESALCFSAVYCVIALFYECYLRLRTGNWLQCKWIDIASVIMVWLVLFTCVALTRRPSEIINSIVWKYEVNGDESTIGRKDNLFWRPALSDTTTGEVEIPSKIGDCDVRRIGDNAFGGCRWVTSVKIPKGVRSIGSGAFEGCSTLNTIVIPKSVVTIGRDVFLGCSVKTIYVEKGDVERVRRLLENSCVSTELFNFEEVAASYK